MQKLFFIVLERTTAATRRLNQQFSGALCCRSQREGNDSIEHYMIHQSRPIAFMTRCGQAYTFSTRHKREAEFVLSISLSTPNAENLPDHLDALKAADCRVVRLGVRRAS